MDLAARKKRRRALYWCIAGVVSAPISTRFAQADPFYVGSDISLLPTIEQLSGSPAGGASGPFKDGGVARPGEQILVNHGDNIFRIRIFVNPQTTYTNTNAGAIQTTAYDIALAQRLKATGAKVILDFHYSDTWADPGHQAIPAAWSSPVQTLTQLESTVQSYTTSTLQAFKTAGVMPDIVQLGNETTSGLLWNTGKLNFSGTQTQQNASWAAYGGLLNAGIAAVRAVQDPGQRIPVALSIDKGDKDGQPQFHYGMLQKSVANGGGGVTDFDIEGVDFYSSSTTGINTMTTNLTTLANTNFAANPNPTASNPLKKIMVLETNYPWKTNGSYTGSWAKTPAGQQMEFTDVRNMVLNLPHNDGEGALWWYPESIQTGGVSIYNGGATAMFDASGNALPVVNAFSLSSPTWNLDSNGTWYNASDWTGGVPMFTDNIANFGSAITAPRTITMNSAETAGTINFNNSNSYTIGPNSGNGITLGVSSGQAAINVTLGSHTIAAPLTLASDTTITVTPAASTLNITGNLTATGKNITKAGAGAVQFQNILAAGLIVNAGSVIIAAQASPNSAAGTSIVGSLSIAANSSLDLTNNALIENYTTPGTLLNDTRIALQSGRLKTSLSAGGFALGYADNATLGRTSFGGQPVGLSAIVIGYTIDGDADLDGTVNMQDFNALAANFGSANQQTWIQGDFNYDGIVNLLDLNILATEFGVSMPSPSSVALGTLVPEPSSLAMIAALIWGVRRRRFCRVANLKV
ncbi:MAG TPA: glycosyl hydrolase 53 family protein [Tepidisphaeraceae bacterium]|nr:glycosyl hydrolase 53 family protein [Tepidisphaeraceae bacterium]